MTYASLRQGLVGAWCPSLGPSGNTLLDRSGYCNHGTLTNMDAGTDWVGSRYGWALDFDGSDATENIPGSQNRIQINRNIVTTAFGVSGWIYWQSANKRGICANGPTNTSPSFAVTILTDGSLETYRGANTSSTARIQLNQWNHFYIFNDNTTTFYYLNGVFSNSAAQSVGGASQTEFYIGYNYWGAVNALLDDFRAYTRSLTPSDIRLLASEPGIGLKPERTSVFFGAQLFNAAWAKNSNQLISAGVI